MDTCAAIIGPTEKNVVYLMLSDRCGPQEGDGGVSQRNHRSQSDMEDNSCALLFSLKSSPAARITLSFPFGLRGVKLPRMIQHAGRQQLHKCHRLCKQLPDVITLKNLPFSSFKRIVSLISYDGSLYSHAYKNANPIFIFPRCARALVKMTRTVINKSLIFLLCFD